MCISACMYACIGKGIMTCMQYKWLEHQGTLTVRTRSRHKTVKLGYCYFHNLMDF